jgi:hypothetical protein
VRVRLALAALAALAAAAPVPAQVPGPARQAGGYRSEVVAVVPAFQWDPPPAGEAAQFLAGAQVAALVPVTARSGGCPADFWLTLSAGARAGEPGRGCAEPAVVTASGGAATVAGWDAIVRANARRHFGAVPGSLAEGTLRTRGCVAAFGPLAALGAADRSGRVAEYHPTLDGGSDCGVSLVDATSFPSASAAVRALREAFPAAGILLVGLPRPGHYGALAALTGQAGVLTGSPRERGLVTIPDLTGHVVSGDPFAVSDLGGPPAAHVARLRDLDRAGHLHRRYAGVYLCLGALPLVLYLVLALRRRWGRRLRPLALALAAYPVAGFLVSALPWWRAGQPGIACAAGVLAASVLVAAVGRNELGIAAVTTAVFAVDLLTGARLQRYGLASYSALNGGRFYGLGNVGFAMFATAAVVVTGALARRYGVRAWLAAYPPLVLLDALPRWGSDFGGAIAVTAAFGAAVATRARRTVVAAGAAAGLAVAMGAAGLDYLRPAADRTHLGAFVDDLLHGRASDLLWRKADAAVHSVTGTFYPLVLGASLAAGIVVLRRLRARGDRSLDVTARALAVLWAVGSLVNDSGVVVAAVGCAVAVPLLVSYAIRTAPDGTPW